MTPAELKQRRAELGMSQARLAAALGVDENTVGSWESGRNHIPPYLHLALDMLALRRAHEKRRVDGIGGAFSVLTEAEARDILAARALRTRHTIAELRRRYGVSRQTIESIWRGETWPHLQPPKTEE